MAGLRPPRITPRRGGGRGSRPLPDPALWGGRRAPPGRRPGAVPPGPIRRAIKRLGPDQARRSEASDAASERSRPGIYRNKRVGATRPRHGTSQGIRLGQCLWTGRSSGAYDLPSNAVGAPCSAWSPRAGRCEVARPVARANRNAATRASDDGVPTWYPSGASLDALTHLGQAPMH